MSRERRGPSALAEPGARSARARRAATPHDLVQLCAFAVGDELYAIDIMRIKEIINPLPITRVPRAPAFVEGVIELRGTILPVVDLRKRFELPAPPSTRASKFLIVAIDPLGSSPQPAPVASGGAARSPTADRWILGVIVDRVLEVIRIARDGIRATPAVAVDEDARFFAGVCQHGDRIVMLLDIDAVLSSGERLSLAGMGQAAALPSPSSRADLEGGFGPPRELARRGRSGGPGGRGGSSPPSKDG